MEGLDWANCKWRRWDWSHDDGDLQMSFSFLLVIQSEIFLPVYEKISSFKVKTIKSAKTLVICYAITWFGQEKVL